MDTSGYKVTTSPSLDFLISDPQWKTCVLKRGTRDPTNDPSTMLRAGLIVAKVGERGGVIQFLDYRPGENIATAVLAFDLNVLGPEGNPRPLITRLLISGRLNSKHLIGLDDEARLMLANNFAFDDDDIE